MRIANPADPIPTVTAIFARALLVMAARIAGTASRGVNVSEAASDATDIAAACVSTSPAIVAPTTPRSRRNETSGWPRRSA